MRKYLTIVLFLIAVTYSGLVTGQQRFPKPEFSTGYVTPSPTTPEPRASVLEYTDVVVLVIVLSIASWIAIKKRSRRLMLWLSVFSLIYFGFYREGCICSIGAIQDLLIITPFRRLSGSGKRWALSLTYIWGWLYYMLLPELILSSAV